MDSPLPDRGNGAVLGWQPDSPDECNSDAHSAQSHWFSPKPGKGGFSCAYLYSWLLYSTCSLYHSQCLILSPCPLDMQGRQVRIWQCAIQVSILGSLTIRLYVPQEGGAICQCTAPINQMSYMNTSRQTEKKTYLSWMEHNIFPISIKKPEQRVLQAA